MPYTRGVRSRVAACLVVVAGCRSGIDLPVAATGPSADAAPAMVDESFEQLYPLFLMRKLSPAGRASLWRDSYQGRWVRWTGSLRSVTANGATFKHLPKTILFDTSVRLDAPGRERLRRLKIGDRVTYTGELVRYEEIVRVFHLVHGDVQVPP